MLGQLGNRIQHALRAYTPKEQKVVKVAAQSFRPNPDLDTIEVISQMGVGEALVSTLQEKGVPMQVERVLIRPPYSRMGAASKAERKALLDADPNMQRYKDSYDPRSAAEILKERMAAALKKTNAAELEERASKPKKRKSTRQGPLESFIKSMARSLGTAAGSSMGKKFFRGILGSLLK